MRIASRPTLIGLHRARLAAENAASATGGAI
jgi:hypothetical protein